MNFRKYRRTNIAEMAEWEPDVGESTEEELHILTNLYKVSVSEEDIKNGSPKYGDMIARNPDNHKDMWLVAKEYFINNFEPI